ncbi:dihydroorotate dehydrogenase electron transfer subunit [Cupriavidus sp. 30B13]|uniref:dihydroorotate dehydrogenase electron transfer subunit n=1 Tax=Cupriavidus sp. 30B13 TaxID=3384241 RepID=UPI003B905E27
MSASLCGAGGAATVASYRCRVVEHRWVNRRYKYLRLEADAPLAAITRPGQFYQLRCPVTDEAQPFLLRPMSVYGAGPEDGRLEFLYNVAGVGTRALAGLPAGGSMDIVGPLGNTFALDPAFRRILVVARGVGLATMAPLVRQAAGAGVAITALMSARSRADLMEREFLRGAAAQVHGVFDEDGSSAVAAVEGLLRRLLAGQRPDAVYTCGSHRLLMLLQRVLADYPQVRGEVAMEQRMACGMGVCLSCVRLFERGGDKQFLRVCREGPVFPIRDVTQEVEFG